MPPAVLALCQSWIRSLTCNTKANAHVHDPLSSSSSSSSSTGSSSSSSTTSGAASTASTGTCHSSSNSSPSIPTKNGSCRNKLMHSRRLSCDHNSSTSSSTKSVHSGHRVQSQNVSCDQQLSLGASNSFRSNSMPTLLNHRHRTVSFRRTLGSMSCYDCSLVQVPIAMAAPSSYSSSIMEHPICQRCGELFPTFDALDHHHLSTHALTELRAGNPSRNVVEIIFKTSWAKERQARQFKIDRVLKVNNPGRRVWRFEEYRDSVKAKAGRLPLEKKHPRCVADGNELLRFCDTSYACPLLPSLCLSTSCHVCTLIHSGFSSEMELPGRSHGIGTPAHDQAGLAKGTKKRAMLLCRVIAGRVYKATTACMEEEDDEDLRSKSKSKSKSIPPVGFDSIAGPPGAYSNIEELRVSHPNAILPCFIVVYSS